MCNQTVGLVAAALERRGIATVAIQLLREVALRVQPPRALAVPFRHGFPLGRPNDPAIQLRVIEAALAVLEEAREAPALAAFPAKDPASPRG